MATGYQGGSSMSTEFEQINGNISSNIYKIKQNVSELAQFSRQIGTDKDTSQSRDQILRKIEDASKLATSTNAYFKRLAGKQWQKNESLIIEKSKRTYKTEMDNFGRVSKELGEKMKTIEIGAGSKRSANKNQSSLLTFEDEEYSERDRLIQKQKQDDLSRKLETVQEREQRIHQIETDIINVNEIMKELAGLVNEQGSIVDNITSNIETTYQNVESGNDQLHKASTYASKYRKKVLILILIAIIICVVVALIIYFSVKKK